MAEEKAKAEVKKPQPKPVTYTVTTKLVMGSPVELVGEGFPKLSHKGANMGEDEVKAAKAAAERCGVALIVTKEG